MNTENKKSLLHILTNAAAIPNTLLDHYRDMGLDAEETLFLVILLRLSDKRPTLTVRNVAKDSVYSEGEVMSFVGPLVDKGFLSFGDDAVISLDGLVEKFLETQSWYAAKAERNIGRERKSFRTDKTFAELYQSFENELGRPLSPIEGEQINYWYKKKGIPAELILAGLARAVLLGKYNLRYIEAILFSWDRRGFKSLKQVEEAEDNDRSRRQKREVSGENRSYRQFQDEDDFFSDDIYE